MEGQFPPQGSTTTPALAPPAGHSQAQQRVGEAKEGVPRQDEVAWEPPPELPEWQVKVHRSQGGPCWSSPFVLRQAGDREEGSQADPGAGDVQPSGSGSGDLALPSGTHPLQAGVPAPTPATSSTLPALSPALSAQHCASAHSQLGLVLDLLSPSPLSWALPTLAPPPPGPAHTWPRPSGPCPPWPHPYRALPMPGPAHSWPCPNGPCPCIASPAPGPSHSGPCQAAGGQPGRSGQPFHSLPPPLSILCSRHH